MLPIVFVLTTETCIEYDTSQEIQCFDSEEKAQNALKNFVDRFRYDGSLDKFAIEDDDYDYFFAYEDGYASRNRIYAHYDSYPIL